MKKISSLVKSQLPCILSAIALLILLLGASTIVCVFHLTKQVESHENLTSHKFRSEIQSELKNITELFNLMGSSSTTNLAGVLSSSLNHSKKLSFSEVESNVAKYLFPAFSTTPHLAQISYTGFGGLFFSYYIDQNQTFALYSNSSNPSKNPNSTTDVFWYTQMANRDDGKLYGNVSRSIVPSITVTNTSRLQEALNSRNNNESLLPYYSFLGSNWNIGQDLLFINTANVVNGTVLVGFVSLGFSAKEVSKYYFTEIVDNSNGTWCLVAGDGKFLAGDSELSIDLMNSNGVRQNISCYSNGTLSVRASHLNETNLIFQCSQLDILGVQSVYVLAIKKSGFIHFVHKLRTITLVLIASAMAITIILVSILIPMIRRSAVREMYLSSNLMKQLNATEQAERKSMNKTHAFATASHDIRASLAGMIGLIEISYDEVTSGSDLETNLRQLEGCTQDLSGMLTSILDASKIEAGKMLLEEEEFDIAQLFEDVVDLYHPMGAKKGVDVILDPCDGSVSKFSRVKCDRVKLRQILCNLLSNAVKFTSEGQVIVRAWIRKPTMESSIIETNQSNKGLVQSLTCMFYKKKNKEESEKLEAVSRVETSDPNSMELVCKVDDTGKGIPKEKQNSVFENYVQVRETALGQGGTGLGLGIVQSLARLMHGEIGIVDKDIGERGSCFRFNIRVTVCDNVSDGTRDQNPSNENSDSIALISSPLSGQQHHVLTPSPSKTDGSFVVLLIQNDERRRIVEKFMESLGVRVFSLGSSEQLPHILKRIKRKCSNNNNTCSSSSLEIDCLSHKSSAVSRNNSCTIDVSTAMDGADYVRSLFRRTSSSLGFVLLVVDTNTGAFSELFETVEEFRNGLKNVSCRVVWLANPMTQSISFNSFSKDNSDDIVKHKPLHGSRLYELAKLLPEFGGSVPKKKFGARENDSDNQIHVNNSNYKPNSQSEIQEVGSSSNIIINAEKPLFGKRVLVVDDNLLQRKIAARVIERLGGKVETCVNGLEAFELVKNGLVNGDSLPDYILMDCEMPVMNGYDATSEIRKIETSYGIHTPIIALTAHTKGSEEANSTFKAGMDACLSRPLKDDHLMDAIKLIHTINS